MGDHGEGDVVGLCSGSGKPVEEFVGDDVCGMGGVLCDEGSESFEAVIEGLVAPFDESVGVGNQHRARWEGDCFDGGESGRVPEESASSSFEKAGAGVGGPHDRGYVAR